MSTDKNEPREERYSHLKGQEPDDNKCAGSGAASDPGAIADAAGESGSGASALTGDIEEMKRLLEAAIAETARFRDEAARAKADFYNYRTRVERDRARDRTLAAEGAVDALIPVLDNLDRTLHAVPDKESPLYKGVLMVQRQFFGALQSLGLQVIETAGPFDPSLHEAVMAVEVDDAGEDGKILEELHRGYRLGEKVLRAAQVKVGRLRKG